MFHKFGEVLKTYIAQIRKFIEEIIVWLTPQAKKLKTELDQVGEHIHPSTTNDEGIRRIAAFGLDLLVSFLLWLFPLGGWILSGAYILLRDSLPFLNGRSTGKRFFHLRVVSKGTLQPLIRNYKQSAKRNITLLIPFINLIDIFFYFTKGERLGDIWAKTIVIDDRYDISSNNGSLT